VQPTSLVGFWNGHNTFSQPFSSCCNCQFWFSKLLIELYLAHWLFMKQGGTPWQYGTASRKVCPFNDRKSKKIGAYVFGYDSQPAAAREVFKPSTDSASLVVPSQKKIFSWFSGWGFTSGGVFAFLWPTLPGPGRPSNGPTFCPKYFYETRLSYESVESLIGFLAYLDEKLCHKNKKQSKILPLKKVTRVE